MGPVYLGKHPIAPQETEGARGTGGETQNSGEGEEDRGESQESEEVQRLARKSERERGGAVSHVQGRNGRGGEVAVAGGR